MVYSVVKLEHGEKFAALFFQEVSHDCLGGRGGQMCCKGTLPFGLEGAESLLRRGGGGRCEEAEAVKGVAVGDGMVGARCRGWS